MLDHEQCGVAGCIVHQDMKRTTSTRVRNEQILDDWASGVWTLEELSSFWGIKPLAIAAVIRRADISRAGTPPLEIAHSR